MAFLWDVGWQKIFSPGFVGLAQYRCTPQDPAGSAPQKTPLVGANSTHQLRPGDFFAPFGAKPARLHQIFLLRGPLRSVRSSGTPGSALPTQPLHRAHLAAVQGQFFHTIHFTASYLLVLTLTYHEMLEGFHAVGPPQPNVEGTFRQLGGCSS